MNQLVKTLACKVANLWGNSLLIETSVKVRNPGLFIIFMEENLHFVYVCVGGGCKTGFVVKVSRIINVQACR